MPLLGSGHDADERRPLQDLAPLELGHAADDADHELGLAGLAPLHFAQPPVDLLDGLLPDAAGIEDDDVGVARVGRGLHAVVQQAPGDLLRVELVHLAAEGLDEEAPRLRLRRGHCHSSGLAWASSSLAAARVVSVIVLPPSMRASSSLRSSPSSSSTKVSV